MIGPETAGYQIRNNPINSISLIPLFFFFIYYFVCVSKEKFKYPKIAELS